MSENTNTKKRTWVTKVIIAFVAFLLLLTFFSNTIMNFFIPKVVGKRISGGNLSYTDKATSVVEPVTKYEIKVAEGRTIEKVLVEDYEQVKKDEVLLKLKYRTEEDASILEELKKELNDLEKEKYYAARVSQAKAKLKQAKAVLKKNKKNKEAKAAVNDAQAVYDLAQKMLFDVTEGRGATKNRQKKIDEVKKLIEEIEKKTEIEEIKSPVDGMVFAVQAFNGDKTDGNAVLMTVIPDTAEYTITFKFDSSSVEKLDPGTEMSTDSYWVEECTVLSVKPDPKDPRNTKLVKCDVKAAMFFPGETVTGYIGRTNSSYDYLAPSGAVFKDNNGSFVYVIDETKSPFGNTYKVRRVDVSVLATDGVYTAISGEDLKSKSIVIRSEEALENGQRVRLEDYGAK